MRQPVSTGHVILCQRLSQLTSDLKNLQKLGADASDSSEKVQSFAAFFLRECPHLFLEIDSSSDFTQDFPVLFPELLYLLEHLTGSFCLQAEQDFPVEAFECGSSRSLRECLPQVERFLMTSAACGDIATMLTNMVSFATSIRQFSAITLGKIIQSLVVTLSSISRTAIALRCHSIPDLTDDTHSTEGRCLIGALLNYVGALGCTLIYVMVQISLTSARSATALHQAALQQRSTSCSVVPLIVLATDVLNLWGLDQPAEAPEQEVPQHIQREHGGDEPRDVSQPVPSSPLLSLAEWVRLISDVTLSGCYQAPQSARTDQSTVPVTDAFQSESTFKMFCLSVKLLTNLRDQNRDPDVDFAADVQSAVDNLKKDGSQYSVKSPILRARLAFRYAQLFIVQLTLIALYTKRVPSFSTLFSTLGYLNTQTHSIRHAAVTLEILHHVAPDAVTPAEADSIHNLLMLLRDSLGAFAAKNRDAIRTGANHLAKGLPCPPLHVALISTAGSLGSVFNSLHSLFLYSCIQSPPIDGTDDLAVFSRDPMATLAVALFQSYFSPLFQSIDLQTDADLTHSLVHLLATSSNIDRVCFFVTGFLEQIVTEAVKEGSLATEESVAGVLSDFVEMSQKAIAPVSEFALISRLLDSQLRGGAREQLLTAVQTIIKEHPRGVRAYFRSDLVLHVLSIERSDSVCEADLAAAGHCTDLAFSYLDSFTGGSISDSCALLTALLELSRKTPARLVLVYRLIEIVVHQPNITPDFGRVLANFMLESDDAFRKRLIALLLAVFDYLRNSDSTLHANLQQLVLQSRMLPEFLSVLLSDQDASHCLHGLLFLLRSVMSHPQADSLLAEAVPMASLANGLGKRLNGTSDGDIARLLLDILVCGHIDDLESASFQCSYAVGLVLRLLPSLGCDLCHLILDVVQILCQNSRAARRIAVQARPVISLHDLMLNAASQAKELGAVDPMISPVLLRAQLCHNTEISTAGARDVQNHVSPKQLHLSGRQPGTLDELLEMSESAAKFLGRNAACPDLPYAERPAESVLKSPVLLLRHAVHIITLCGAEYFSNEELKATIELLSSPSFTLSAPLLLRAMQWMSAGIIYSDGVWSQAAEGSASHTPFFVLHGGSRLVIPPTAFWPAISSVPILDSIPFGGSPLRALISRDTAEPQSARGRRIWTRPDHVVFWQTFSVNLWVRLVNCDKVTLVSIDNGPQHIFQLILDNGRFSARYQEKVTQLSQSDYTTVLHDWCCISLIFCRKKLALAVRALINGSDVGGEQRLQIPYSNDQLSMAICSVPQLECDTEQIELNLGSVLCFIGEFDAPYTKLLQRLGPLAGPSDEAELHNTFDLLDAKLASQLFERSIYIFTPCSSSGKLPNQAARAADMEDAEPRVVPRSARVVDCVLKTPETHTLPEAFLALGGPAALLPVLRAQASTLARTADCMVQLLESISRTSTVFSEGLRTFMPGLMAWLATFEASPELVTHVLSFVKLLVATQPSIAASMLAHFLSEVRIDNDEIACILCDEIGRLARQSLAGKDTYFPLRLVVPPFIVQRVIMKISSQYRRSLLEIAPYFLGCSQLALQLTQPELQTFACMIYQALRQKDGTCLQDLVKFLQCYTETGLITATELETLDSRARLHSGAPPCLSDSALSLVMFFLTACTFLPIKLQLFAILLDLASSCQLNDYSAGFVLLQMQSFLGFRQVDESIQSPPRPGALTPAMVAMLLDASEEQHLSGVPSDSLLTPGTEPLQNHYSLGKMGPAAPSLLYILLDCVTDECAPALCLQITESILKSTSDATNAALVSGRDAQRIVRQLVRICMSSELSMHKSCWEWTQQSLNTLVSNVVRTIAQLLSQAVTLCSDGDGSLRVQHLLRAIAETETDFGYEVSSLLTASASRLASLSLLQAVDLIDASVADQQALTVFLFYVSAFCGTRCREACDNPRAAQFWPSDLTHSPEIVAALIRLCGHIRSRLKISQFSTNGMPICVSSVIEANPDFTSGGPLYLLSRVTCSILESLKPASLSASQYGVLISLCEASLALSSSIPSVFRKKESLPPHAASLASHILCFLSQIADGSMTDEPQDAIVKLISIGQIALTCYVQATVLSEASDPLQVFVSTSAGDLMHSESFSAVLQDANSQLCGMIDFCQALSFPDLFGNQPSRSVLLQIRTSYLEAGRQAEQDHWFESLFGSLLLQSSEVASRLEACRAKALADVKHSHELVDDWLRVSPHINEQKTYELLEPDIGGPRFENMVAPEDDRPSDNDVVPAISEDMAGAMDTGAAAVPVTDTETDAMTSEESIDSRGWTPTPSDGTMIQAQEIVLSVICGDTTEVLDTLVKSSGSGDQPSFGLNMSLRVPCERVIGFFTIPGYLSITAAQIQFQFDPEGFAAAHQQLLTDTIQDPEGAIIYCSTYVDLGERKVEYHRDEFWQRDTLMGVRPLRFLLRKSALELSFTSGAAEMFNFSLRDRNRVYSFLQSGRRHRDKLLYPVAEELIAPATELWANGQLSNFDYLMQVNEVAERTRCNYGLWPVMPWVLRDYTSPTIDLRDADVYRDFMYPAAAQSEEKREAVAEQYQQRQEMGMDLQHWSVHYTSSAVVLGFLIRLPPFTQAAVDLQDGHFDHPDRCFNSLPESWSSVTRFPQDNRELIPELYSLPELLLNINHIRFGYLHDSTGRSVGRMNDVALPPWAQGSPERCVQIMRAALESDYVSLHLHEWIDLIFGIAQRGEEAVKRCNVFPVFSYPGSDPAKVRGYQQRNTLLCQIAEFGQTPVQVFSAPHRRRILRPRLGGIVAGFYHLLEGPYPDNAERTAYSTPLCSTTNDVFAFPAVLYAVQRDQLGNQIALSSLNSCGSFVSYILQMGKGSSTLSLARNATQYPLRFIDGLSQPAIESAVAFSQRESAFFAGAQVDNSVVMVRYDSFPGSNGRGVALRRFTGFHQPPTTVKLLSHDTVLAAAAGESVFLWRLSTPGEPITLNVGSSRVVSLAEPPGGHIVAVATTDGLAYLFNQRTGAFIRSFALGGPALQLEAGRWHGRSVLVAVTRGLISGYSIQGQEFFSVVSDVASIRIVPSQPERPQDDNILTVFSNSGKLEIRHLITGALIRSAQLPQSFDSIVMANDGNLAFFIDNGRLSVREEVSPPQSLSLL